MRQVPTAGVIGALAEFERELIGERTNAGLAAARARGRHGGRPTVMPSDKVDTARQMYDSKDYTVDAIARVLGISRASIYHHLAEPPRAVAVAEAPQPSAYGQFPEHVERDSLGRWCHLSEADVSLARRRAGG